MRCGAFDGIYFAHRNAETSDIQGFEQRWQKDGQANTARFAKGGLKTIATLGNADTATRIAIFEGGLDALALAEIEMRDDTLYVSTGGGFGPKTEDAIARVAEGKTVFSAFDNDKAGNAMHKKLIGFIPAAKRLSPPSQVQGSDKVCTDWLDVLNARKQRAVKPTEPAAMLPDRALGEDLSVDRSIETPGLR